MGKEGSFQRSLVKWEWTWEGWGVSQVPQCAYGNLGFFHTVDGLCLFAVVVPSCIRCGFAWCRFSSTSCHLKPLQPLVLFDSFLSSRGGREAGRGLLRHNMVDLNLLGSFREPGLCACVYMYISVSKTSTYLVSLRELGEKTCTVVALILIK